jgi:hypothetical protein
LATSVIVLTTLLSAQSMAPCLGLAADSAPRILTLVRIRVRFFFLPSVLLCQITFQEVKDNDSCFTNLANDAYGLVFMLVIECRRMINDGQGIPDHIQRHIPTLSE